MTNMQNVAILRHFPQKECLNCKKTFSPNIWNQIFCGSKTKKEGCSYKMHLARIRKYIQTNYREYMRSYQRKWKKEQRKVNSLYAQRQLEAKRKYGKSLNGRSAAQAWRKKNITKILFWNKNRTLKIRGTIGNHTIEEWNKLKREYNNKCAICGIEEEKLISLWNRKGFDRLTRDHIIPLAHGGTNYIQNIQPLCISCNARKWAYEEVMHG